MIGQNVAVASRLISRMVWNILKFIQVAVVVPLIYLLLLMRGQNVLEASSKHTSREV
jgi:hypothetical protein